MPKKGFYWHLHHEVLLEWCHDYDERARYTRTNKPESEKILRFKLFKPVKGQLPKELIRAGQAYEKAWQAFYKTLQTYCKTNKTYNKMRLQACAKAYYKTQQDHHKAMRTFFNQAKQAYKNALINNAEFIEKLHSLECPNCPWDGETIFP